MYLSNTDLDITMIDICEEYEGEGRDIALQHFIDNRVYNDLVPTKCSLNGSEILLNTSAYLTPFEVLELKLLEKYSPESFWDNLDIETLNSVLSSHRVAA